MLFKQANRARGPPATGYGWSRHEHETLVAGDFGNGNGHGGNVKDLSKASKSAPLSSSMASWQDVSRVCPDTVCLDPNTLGVAHVVSDYRVRAEGPGGSGPWCEPLPVDLLIADELDGTEQLTGASVLADGDSWRRPMATVHPGSRERDSLTGEVRRSRVMRRPFQKCPSSSAVAAAVVAKEKWDIHRHGREVGVGAAGPIGGESGEKKQFFWSALASPRAARGCLAAAVSLRSDTARTTAGIGYCAFNSFNPSNDLPWEGDREVDGEASNGSNKNEGVSCRAVVEGSDGAKRKPLTWSGWRSATSIQAFPQALALILHRELDLVSPAGGSVLHLGSETEERQWQGCVGEERDGVLASDR